MHQDESGMDDIEGLVLKRQRLTYVHLQKPEVFRKRSAKMVHSSGSDNGRAEAMGWERAGRWGIKKKGGEGSPFGKRRDIDCNDLCIRIILRGMYRPSAAPCPGEMFLSGKHGRQDGAEKNPPNLQDSLRVSQIGKCQFSAEKPRNALMHRVEPVNPSRSAMQLSKGSGATGTHLSFSLEVALADWNIREFLPEHNGETRRRLT